MVPPKAVSGLTVPRVIGALVNACRREDAACGNPGKPPVGRFISSWGEDAPPNPDFQDKIDLIPAKDPDTPDERATAAGGCPPKRAPDIGTFLV